MNNKNNQNGQNSLTRNEFFEVDKRITDQKSKLKRKYRMISLLLILVLLVSSVVLIAKMFLGSSSDGDNSLPEFAAVPAPIPASISIPTPTAPSAPVPVPPPTSAPVPTPAAVPAPTSAPVKVSPSASDIDDYGGNIAYPSEESYLDDYETQYVQAPKGHAIYVFWSPHFSDDTRRNMYVYHGDAVTVIARENGASCILFVDNKDRKRAGWVNSAHLVNN